MIRILTTIVALFAVCVSATTTSAWAFDETVQKIEAKLAIVEKQAETLIKMLDSQTHQPRLQGDIDRFRTCKDAAGFTSRDTYLYRVFKQLEIPLEGSAITLKELAPSVPPANKERIQPLAPNFLLELSIGTFRGLTGVYEVWKGTTFLANGENAAKLVSIGEKVISIQEPVHRKIRERLNVAGQFCVEVGEQGGGFYGFSEAETLAGNLSAAKVYGFMLPPRVGMDMSGFGFFLQKFFTDATVQQEYAPGYLRYLQKLVRYILMSSDTEMLSIKTYPKWRKTLILSLQNGQKRKTSVISRRIKRMLERSQRNPTTA